ncbi:MAG TPA: hypothetical protein VEK07_14665 [Polyangiaceae bacterium]|nr:hypothetical protein [Polyangiaceae bacterium]
MALAKSGAVCGAAAVPLVLVLASHCSPPDTSVVVDNDYPANSPAPLVVYQAYWQTATFTTPIPPGSSSASSSAVPASATTAYAVLAPGWNPAGSTPPSSLVVLQSQMGFSVHLDDTLHIPVDDTTFAGNCAAGSFLTQPQADFITQIVFPGVFACLTYDAAACTVSPMTDGGCEGGGGTSDGGDP